MLGEGSLLSVLRPKCAERPEGVWEPTLSSAIWILGRRVEVIADDLPLWHGAQLAIDTTLVSPLHGDGTATASGPAGERGDLPRTVRRGGKSPLGGPRGRGGRSMVSGGINFLEGLGEGTRSSGATHLARTSAGRSPSSVEFPLGVQFGESFCNFSDGVAARALGRGGGSSMNDVLRDARFQ